MESEKILHSPYCRSKEIVDLFLKLLEETGYDLDQLAGSNSFLIPQEGSEEIESDLKKLLGLIKGAYRENENALELFENIDKGEHSDKFIVLLERYLESSAQPAKETAFLRALTLDQFGSMVDYCYSNYVITNNDAMADVGQWETKQLQILIKVILTVSELVVLFKYSKKRVLHRINEMFYLDEKYGEVLWNIAKENEEQLWKYLMVMRSERIEEKLDLLLELAQSAR